MINFNEKDIKKACKKRFSFFINEKFLNNVKSLSIWVSGDSISLKDLELFPNLVDLYIDKDEGTYEIEDIDVIYKCEKLKILTLSKCKSFYFPINYFQNLTELYFYDTEIEDFYFLREMPQLNDLILTGENVRDIGFLKYLPSLKYLSLEETSVRDISPLKYLVELEDIDFEDNDLIEDYSVIDDLLSLLSYSIDGDYFDKDEEYADDEKTDEEYEEKEKNRSSKKIISKILIPIFYFILAILFIYYKNIFK